MTFDERVQAVTTFGFTERQAGFLVTVMLHAGVCLGRHYCTFADIAYGRKMHDFFERVVTRRYGTFQTCRHNTARLYHIHSKRLYAAIGEPDNRHRKPTAFPRAVERLMVLDAVLADRERVWLATESDKLAHFTLNHRVPQHDLPSLTFRAEDCETVRYFRQARSPSMRTTWTPVSYLVSDWRLSTSGPSSNAISSCCAHCPCGRYGCSSRGIWRVGSPRITRLSANTWRCRCAPEQSRNCVGTFGRVGARQPTPNNGSMRLRGHSAHRDSKRCIGRGLSAAIRCSKRRYRPCFVTPSSGARGGLNTMSYVITICISRPWSARRNPAVRRKRGGKWTAGDHFRRVWAIGRRSWSASLTDRCSLPYSSYS